MVVNWFVIWPIPFILPPPSLNKISPWSVHFCQGKCTLPSYQGPAHQTIQASGKLCPWATRGFNESAPPLAVASNYNAATISPGGGAERCFCHAEFQWWLPAVRRVLVCWGISSVSIYQMVRGNQPRMVMGLLTKAWHATLIMWSCWWHFHRFGVKLHGMCNWSLMCCFFVLEVGTDVWKSTRLFIQFVMN